MLNSNNLDIILGLDVSTSCIGCCIYLNTENDFGEIIELTHIAPKVKTKTNTTEELFLKKEIFEKDFLEKWKDKGITKVIIEEPLLSSNNVNTVATLLRFNGMISESVYKVLGLSPNYISSYSARKYAFPDLMSVRKYNKKGELYSVKHIMDEIKKNNVSLFASYPFDIDKKLVMWNKVSEVFPNIEWIYNKKGELRKENFDANDALITCIAYSNMLKYGDINFKITNVSKDEKKITFFLNYWDKQILKEISLFE